jgi:hypothetical protein
MFIGRYDRCKFLIISLILPFCVESKFEDNEVGGTCGTNGGEEECIYVIGRKAGGNETTKNTET